MKSYFSNHHDKITDKSLKIDQDKTTGENIIDILDRIFKKRGCSLIFYQTSAQNNCFLLLKIYHGQQILINIDTVLVDVNKPHNNFFFNYLKAIKNM